MLCVHSSSMQEVTRNFTDQYEFGWIEAKYIQRNLMSEGRNLLHHRNYLNSIETQQIKMAQK